MTRLAFFIAILLFTQKCFSTDISDNSSTNETIAPKESKTLTKAIDIIKPLMINGTYDLETASLGMAIWSARNLRWQDLQDQPKAKFLLVIKDPNEHIGNRICTSGRVVSIRAGTADGEKYFHGFLSNFDKLYRFIAVKSTGDIVEGSRAAFCGIVTGADRAGTSEFVYLVGMFELPENTGI